MDARPSFHLAVSQNRFMSTEDHEMHGIVTVTTQGLRAGLTGQLPGPAGPAGEPLGLAGPQVAEVILVDCSGSMDQPPTKMTAARRATVAAIDILRDGVLFAVVEGTDRARMVYPESAELVAATEQTRAAGRTAVGRLYANGGTAIGTWLTQARELLEEHPSAVRHAILLTDGRNRHETPEKLDQVLAACEGHFVCDARGIGTDWSPKELLRIASVLRGKADAVRDPADLAADFREMLRQAMTKVVPDLRIRITTTPWVRLRFLKQVFPTESELTGQAVAVNERTVEISLGSWGDESRDYHLCLAVEPTRGARGHDTVGEDLRAARLDLLAGGQPRCDPAVVLVCWTDDLVASTRIDARVGHYVAHEELSQAVVAGCDAYDANDLPAAEAAWGRAVQLATAAGNEEVLKRLERLVDIADPAAGDVRLKDNPHRSDVLAVEVGSYISTRSPDLPGPAVPRPHPATGPNRTCAGCGRISPASATLCTQCGQPLVDGESGEPITGRST